MKDRFDGWIRLAVIIGGMYYAHTDSASRIDSGKDEQRLHWQSERRHADSLNTVRWDSLFRIMEHKKFH